MIAIRRIDRTRAIDECPVLVRPVAIVRDGCEARIEGARDGRVVEAVPVSHHIVVHHGVVVLRVGRRARVDADGLTIVLPRDE